MCQIKSPDQFSSLAALVSYFKDEQTCLRYLEEGYWGGEMRCPFCGFDKPYRFKNGIKFKCRSCREPFTAKMGTIFQSSKLPMVKWYMAIYLIASHKKGIPSTQLARDLGVTQKTAWFMLQRIRESMKQNDEKMEGVLQIDECFVGGKNKNRHVDKKVKYGGKGRSFADKMPVLGIINQETGEARTIVIPNVEVASIEPQLRKHIETGSMIYSDEHGYGDLKGYTHKSINHAGKCFRIGDVTTNKVENLWSHFKRTIFGIYHYVSFKHLQRYANEITFRFNTRLYSTEERMKLLFSRVNCRITYKKLISPKYGYFYGQQ